MHTDSTGAARKTALYDVHVAAGGRIVDFAGWMMPVWFAGISKEHECVRTRVGLFDVSHMGQIHVTGPDAQSAVEWLITNNVSRLEPGQAAYSPMLHPHGGIVDDLIVYKRSETDIFICVNAGTTAKDFAHMSANIKGNATFVNVSDHYSQIAVQGPKALPLLAKIWPDQAAALKPFRFLEFKDQGNELLLAGTGYTGEKGFEIYVPWNEGPRYWKMFMDAGQEFGVMPIGLGARDSLRLESRYSLYGHDITDSTNPIEAGLKWTVDFSKEFNGKEAILPFKDGETPRKLVGFEMVDRGIPREHCAIYVGEELVGEVTSGDTSPTLGKAIGLGYVKVPHHKRGTELFIDIRGRKVKAKVVKTPFYTAAE